MISVVIPVLNGGEQLDEVLGAVTGQVIDEPFEVLVIDSGSTDGSLEIVAAHPGVRLIEIDKSEFGHGRTRNLGVQNTSGELIAFLTQDATPASEGWLAAYRSAFELAPNVGGAFGPHLPRPGTSPLMARLLRDHFDSFADPGDPQAPVLQGPDGPIYLSNSNSCIARAAWEAAPFRDVAYAEDQAFGADLLANGFVKAYVPAAAALHSHDYDMVQSFRRYFDEYRGLSDSVGEHTEASAGRALEIVRESVAADRAFLAELGQPAWRRAAWSARSAVYHAGRVGFGGLGARANRLPGRVREVLSFEGRSDGTSFEIPATGPLAHSDVLELERSGALPLEPRTNSGEAMHIAWVVPPFGIGGGGHTTIFRMIRALERHGHRCSIWVHDPAGLDRVHAGTMRKRIADHYMRLEAPVHTDFGEWRGADIAVATGWDTVHRILRLPATGARAYFVQDHEPEFHASSSAALFAADSYRHGLHCICASPWLAELVEQRYGASASAFKLGVDTTEYSPSGMPRRNDTIAFYARTFTERRAVELGLLALDEVKRRRPNTRLALYGSHAMVRTPWPYEHIGVVSPARLRRLYNEATVGLSLSLTNYSLIPQEMMACGLPVVELAGRACEGVFGDDGRVISLARDSAVDIAECLLALLDDPALRAEQSAAGLAFARAHTWDDATATVVATLERLHREAAAPRPWAAGSLI
jgi:glycosyltransferase involved in cell wall biosynthesis/GT2 family glycosyltransferase